MKFNFKKIASVLASVAMVGSTLGVAAAANYPAPFIEGGVADVAVVYGANAATSDALQAGNVQSDLQFHLGGDTASSGVTTEGSVSGEAFALFTSSTKIYINDSVNVVKPTVTETELPTVLEDGDFSGDVDATYTQTITMGSNPKITYAKQPTSDEDPSLAITLSTTTANYLYNTTVIFNKAINFTHSDSEGERLTLFGSEFTIAAGTSTTDLVLLKSAVKVDLTSDDPIADVTVSEKSYTLELVSASDTAATIKVTDSDGNSDSKEVTESNSKKIQGLTIAVNTADETNFKLSASIVAGAEKLTFTHGSAVTSGESADVIDGTSVNFVTTSYPGNLSQLRVSVVAKDGDNDAILSGGSFSDPVFGGFKVELAGFNIEEDSTVREDIVISDGGDDSMEISFTDSRGDSVGSFQFIQNYTHGAMWLQTDSDGRNISVVEGQRTYRNEYMVVGNEDEGRLVKVSTITNQTTGYSNDKVKFTDALSGDTYEATITSESGGTINIGGRIYTVYYNGASTAAEETRWVVLNYPDSSAATTVVAYPTIETSKGAKLSFYEPLTINITNFDEQNNDMITLQIPDGDGYASVTFTASAHVSNWTIAGTGIVSGNQDLNSSEPVNAPANGGTVKLIVSGLNYNLSGGAAINMTTLYLIRPDAYTNMLDPALVIWEEEDDNNEYKAIVVEIEAGATGDDGIGVNDVIRSWQNDGTWDAISLASDSKKSKEIDLWGTIALIDSSDSDQKTATISYPDSQIYAQVYIAEEGASITGGSTTSGDIAELGNVVIKDSEVSSVQSKNLLVVGGSCINAVAAKLLDSGCGASFTDATGVGADQYLIESFKNPYLGDDTSKIAVLVAGYEAADTVNAITYLRTEKPATDVGTKLKGTTATSAELVTE